MNRAEFLLAAAAAPFALHEAAAAPEALAFVTADTESHVAVVDLAHGTVVRRIETLPSPFSVERVAGTAVVAHTVSGRVTVLDGRRLAVKHVVAGFGEPRYTADAGDGRHAFVSDAGLAELVTVDVLRGTVVARLKLSQWPRHLSLSPDGTTLWVGLGTATPQLAVVDVSDPLRPRLHGHERPGFLAHDVGQAPDGESIWVTSGVARTIGVLRRGLWTMLPADGAPQHVTFLDGRAFVTSGASGTLHVYETATHRLLATTPIPVGSYNVQFAAGRVLTPSLNLGTLCVLDVHGRVLERPRIAPSSHDACLARS
ncbi:MAG: YncE family protein [Gaiellaceae bacterium]